MPRPLIQPPYQLCKRLTVFTWVTLVSGNRLSNVTVTRPTMAPIAMTAAYLAWPRLMDSICYFFASCDWLIHFSTSRSGRSDCSMTCSCRDCCAVTAIFGSWPKYMYDKNNIWGLPRPQLLNRSSVGLYKSTTPIRAIHDTPGVEHLVVE